MGVKGERRGKKGSGKEENGGGWNVEVHVQVPWADPEAFRRQGSSQLQEEAERMVSAVGPR